MEQGRMLSLRRFFFEVAENVGADVGAAGIVTGEALGQKSSQTARNFAVTSRATTLPIHRPLLTWDKQEIVARAREIGTFADSTIPISPSASRSGAIERTSTSIPCPVPAVSRSARRHRLSRW